MKFRINVALHQTTSQDDSLAIVNYDAVVFEILRTLQTKRDDFGREFAPIKQYFVEIIPDDDGPIANMHDAVFYASIKMQGEVATAGTFTLWIKGRRYSKFPCQLDDALAKEVYYDIDSDMSFNREEWGLTQEQREC